MSLPAFDASNPLWPLPANYNRMGLSEQKIARLRLLTSWWDAKKPKMLITDKEAFYYAFKFFKEFYLKGWEGNKQIYTDDSPKFHDDWVKWFSEHPLMVLTSFRGSAKTLLFGLEMTTFLLVCRPFTPVQYTSAEDTATNKQIREVRLQVENNTRILNDFGNLRPDRADGQKWTEEYIELANGSSFKGLSFKRKIRGTQQGRSQRALLQIFDDPEDDREIKNPALLRAFEDRFWDVLMPAGAPDAWRIWTNTRLDAVAFASKAKTDPKFSNWHFVQQDIAYFAPNPDSPGENVLRSYWPERWSDTVVQAMAGETGTLKGVVSYGNATFLTEFMNDPRRKGRSAFSYDPEVHLGSWGTKDGKECLIDPRTKAMIPFEELRKRSNSVVSFDVSLGRTSHSDLSAILVSLLDDENTLWVIDYWSARARPKEVADKALTLAEKYNVTAWALQKTLLELTLLDFVLDELDRRKVAGQYYPELALTKGFSADKKIDHILSLAWRFRQNKIVLVRPKQDQVDAVAGFLELEDQITFFTERGAFKFDDMLDALVTAQDGFMLLGSGVTPRPEKDPLKVAQQQAREDGVSPFVGMHMMNPGDIRNSLERSWGKRKNSNPGGLYETASDPDNLVLAAGDSLGDSLFCGAETW